MVKFYNPILYAISGGLLMWLLHFWRSRRAILAGTNLDQIELLLYGLHIQGDTGKSKLCVRDFEWAYIPTLFDNNKAMLLAIRRAVNKASHKTPFLRIGEAYRERMLVTIRETISRRFPEGFFARAVSPFCARSSGSSPPDVPEHWFCFIPYVKFRGSNPESLKVLVVYRDFLERANVDELLGNATSESAEAKRLLRLALDLYRKQPDQFGKVAVAF